MQFQQARADTLSLGVGGAHARQCTHLLIAYGVQ